MAGDNTQYSMIQDPRPLIAHVIYRFDTGGLENGVVNLINHMPTNRYRHVVIALTEITEFKYRVSCKDVAFISLHKKPGHGIWLYPKLFRLFRELRPNIVHTRNLAALEAVVPAWAAGIPVRIHSEHGREGPDLDPENRKYHLIRKLYRPFVTQYLALSRDLSDYMQQYVGIPKSKLVQIYNGVDCTQFSALSKRQHIVGCPFTDINHWIIGTIGRMHAVKDQMGLARAFVIALDQHPEMRERLRLIMVGNGPDRTGIQQFLTNSGVADISWLPGEREDIPQVLQGLDCFVLPSRSEGISNTILEAMASSLPIIATNVGGNPELVINDITGNLVSPNDPLTLAKVIIEYANAPEKAGELGRHGRQVVERQFSLTAMIDAYCKLYDSLLINRVANFPD